MISVVGHFVLLHHTCSMVLSDVVFSATVTVTYNANINYVCITEIIYIY